MTSTLLLLLRGPMQSWGDSSRYTVRETQSQPTKSGIVGLVAAAEGRRRSDPIEDLAALKFGVRVDQPGVVAKDFQTANDRSRGVQLPLVSRYYLHDAVFVAALEGHRTVLEDLESALRRPQYPLFLGRRSCPSNSDLVIGVVDLDLATALRSEPWHAARHHRSTQARTVLLPLSRDAAPDEVGRPTRDVPLSFAQENRDYGWRDVIDDEPVELDNPDGRGSGDPFLEAVMSA